YDYAQLLKEREAYDKQMEAFKNEIERLWDVLEIVYRDSKSFLRVNDFDDIARKAKNKIKRKIKSASGDTVYEDLQKSWNEILHIRAGDTDVEKLNQTYVYEKTLLNKMIRRSKEKIKDIYGFQNPRTRVMLDERSSFLENEFEEFDYRINPYHIQPGLILDIDITSIKRKKFTLNGMANVLNEFLHGVSKGFQDAAFASFSRRRSTVRADITQSFNEDVTAEVPDHVSYSASIMAESQPAGRAQVKGKADVTPAKKKKSGIDDLKEL
ncbi:MAG: cytochrome C oxidase subunit II, partial [Spirochaetes bacterium]|nr:cytochrome C oxidase subunit II [Spirochaetota bacterium]